jgi:hypothetical protein
MASAARGEVPQSLNVLPFALLEHVDEGGADVIRLAATLELYSSSFSTKSAMLMLLQTWLFVAERDGVATRQPLYADAAKRAVTAVNATLTIPQALALLRLQEARPRTTSSSASQHEYPDVRCRRHCAHAVIR